VKNVKTVRPLVRLLSTLVGLAMMTLPAVASASDGTSIEYEGPLESTSVSFPLLGSTLTVDVTIGSDGSIESVSFDPDPGFNQIGEGDDLTFRFESEGVVYEIEIETEDGKLKIELETEDEGDDDHNGLGDDDDDDDDDDDHDDDDSGDDDDDHDDDDSGDDDDLDDDDEADDD